jgi:HD-GYP domain-containing protein (c-di-GMP phosphodiesterase class II)
MERIRIRELQTGKVYPKPLFSSSGQMLLNAGTALTDAHLKTIQRFGELEVFLADSVADLKDVGLVEAIDASKLKVGATAAEGVLTGNGRVLVEAGEAIEPHHLDALKQTVGAFVSKQKQEQRRERMLASDALVEQLEKEIPGLKMHVTPEPPNTALAWLKPAPAHEWLEPAKLTQWRGAKVESLKQCYARVEAGVPVLLGELTPIVDALADKLIAHPTRFTQLALLCPRNDDYLPDHAFTVTVLAMAAATQLKWPLAAVKDVGLAGLVYDLGMLLVPERIRAGTEKLADVDRARVQRHPIFSLSMIQGIQTIPPIIQLAALQHHERENGTGYPRGRRRDNVCDYARVLAVADSFAAATQHRTYRKPKLPYIAMEETLRSTTNMALWKPAVRALLEAAGLFPVGSYVKLSNGKNAHVLASNPKQLDRPTIQPLDESGKPTGEAVDLATKKPGELSVVRPLATSTG